MTPGQGGPPAPPPYGPAPLPPSPVPPGEPAERPLALRAGLGGFSAWAALELAGAVYLFGRREEAAEALLREGSGIDAGPLVQAGIDPAAFVGAVLLGFGVLLGAAVLLFAWLAWRGQGWARVALWAVGVPALLLGTGGTGLAQFRFLDVLGVFQAVVLAAGVVLLASRTAGDWFRAEKERRTSAR